MCVENIRTKTHCSAGKPSRVFQIPGVHLLPTATTLKLLGAYQPRTSFSLRYQSLSIHASNSVISIALPAIITKLVWPSGTQS